MTNRKQNKEPVSSKSSRSGHYVYLYRARDGHPLYVGYGAQPGRANVHRSGRSHNPVLHESLLHDSGVSVEIVGPFGSKEAALMVETALISALRTKCNLHPGMSEWRFRPFGVPPQFIDRRETLLNYDALRRKAVDEGGLLLVYVNSRDFEDGRKGYDLAQPPSDEEILTRVDRWWQLAKHAANWKSGAENGPRYLLGVSGPPGARFVVASCEIASWKNWDAPANSQSNGLIKVPTKTSRNLDALQLRGTKVEESPSLAFGSFRHQQYILLRENGTRLGGVKAIAA